MKTTDGNGVSLTGLIIFTLLAALTATLLITAAVVWLADLLHSVPLACLIAGGVSALLSGLLYICSVRRSVDVLQEYASTVYEPSRIAKAGYDRVKAWYDLLFG